MDLSLHLGSDDNSSSDVFIVGARNSMWDGVNIAQKYSFGSNHGFSHIWGGKVCSTVLLSQDEFSKPFPQVS